MNKTPLVSVIIPTFNRCELLKRAIESVLCQTYQNIEIVVLDNASTDGTDEYLKALNQAHFHIRHIRNKSNIGGIANWQQMENYVRGEYFTVLSDDDYIFPTFFETAIFDLLENPDVPMWSSRCMMIDEGEDEGDFMISSLSKREESAISFIRGYIRRKRLFFVANTVFKKQPTPLFTANSHLIDQMGLINGIAKNGVIYSPKILAIWTAHKSSWWHSLRPSERYLSIKSLNESLTSILDKEKSFFKKIIDLLTLKYFEVNSFFDYYFSGKHRMNTFKDRLEVLAILINFKNLIFIPLLVGRYIKYCFKYFTKKVFLTSSANLELKINNELDRVFDVILENGEEKQLLTIMKLLSLNVSKHLYVKVLWREPFYHAVADYYFEDLKKRFVSYGVPPGMLIAERTVFANTQEKQKAKQFVDKILHLNTMPDIETTLFFSRALCLRRRYGKDLSKLMSRSDWQKIYC